jgi:ubiquinone/menaquinone biosynthesis C-methylase UbiE
MRLSKPEFYAMNNPVRRYIQKHVEFNLMKKHLAKHNIDLKGKAILDAGCGSGYGTSLILEEFAPTKLVAFDFMPEQIEIAKKRNLPVDFFVGDVTEMELEPSSFDAVFIFGILHHVPSWRKGLKEVARVLKPGGVFLVEEISTSNIFFHFSNLVGFKHPKEARFTWPEFEEGIKAAGLKILEKKSIILKGTKSYLCQL